MAKQQPKNEGPVEKFHGLTPAGKKLEVSVWEREDRKTGEIYHVASPPTRSYKNEDGKWVKITSLAADEIPTGIELTKQALDYIKKKDVDAQSVG